MPELKIGSSLNFSNVNELLNDSFIADCKEAVVLDFSTTEHVDSAGVALILHWMRLCQSKGLGFSLLGVSDQLQTLFDAYDLQGVFNANV